MKKITILLAVLTIFSICLPAQGQPWDGNGIEGDPYLIYDANDMQAIGADPNYWDAHFELINDVNLAEFTGTEFNLIGNDSNAFTGVFDGDGFIILNLTVDHNDTAHNFLGLFGYNEGSIINVSVKNCNIRGAFSSEYVGGISGINNGLVSNCYVSGSIRGGAQIGGLVGENSSGGNISNCSVKAIINGQTLAGGLVGDNQGNINKCFSDGTVYGNGSNAIGGLVGRSNNNVSSCYSTSNVICSQGWWVGGLVGWNVNLISNCYSTGSVSGEGCVGGLVGWNASSNSNVSHCYSTGDVIGNSTVGGIVGTNDGGVIGVDGVFTDSFWDIESSGLTDGDGGIDPDPLGITGKTTKEMKQKSTFTNWDFTETWGIEDNQTYPFLRMVLLDPVELLLDLAQNVVDLELPQGIETPLCNYLDQATKHLDAGRVEKAIDRLENFIDKVEKDKKIPEADANALIEATLEIINLLIED